MRERNAIEAELAKVSVKHRKEAGLNFYPHILLCEFWHSLYSSCGVLFQVCKERSAEPELRKIDALHQRCLNAERIKEDMSAALQSAQSKLKKAELE